MKLPTDQLNVGDVEKYWTKDRIHLIQCKRYRKILEDYYNNRDKELSN